jgi:hypothetical protein
MERCLREIAAIEAELRSGNPDVAGLCLALSDWSAELRLREGPRNFVKHKNPNEGAFDEQDR